MDFKMRFATRINSFLQNNVNFIDTIDKLSAIDGLTDVDLNFPEHFDLLPLEKLKSLLRNHNLAVNGISARFREEFIRGEFSCDKNTDRTIDLATKCVDASAELGGTVITIWLAYDGNDYSFQLDYEKAWNRVVESLRAIADYNKSMRISIEFKPFEPRAHSIIPGTGYSLHMLDKIGRDNVGLTLDYCHMLMGRENPAMALSIVASEKRLFGVHLNDGHGTIDNGLMFGSVNLVRAFEFIYYLKKVEYSGTVYFDTFPVREDPIRECEMNIAVFNKMWQKIESIGMDKIHNIVEKNDGLETQRLLLDRLL